MKSSVDWSNVSKSNPEFKKLEVAVCELQKADLNLMLSQQQKQAFWLNIYHTLLLHVLFISGQPTSTYAKKLFYSNFRYRIGPYAMSLLDIELGVIRGNPVVKVKEKFFFLLLLKRATLRALLVNGQTLIVAAL